MAGGREGVLLRCGGRGAGTQPQLPGPQLRPRAQEQIVLGGGGGGSGSGSGPPRSQLRINKGRRWTSGGGAPPSVLLLLWNNKK